VAGKRGPGGPRTQGTPVTRFPADATGGSTPVMPRTQNPTNPGVCDPRPAKPATRSSEAVNHRTRVRPGSPWRFFGDVRCSSSGFRRVVTRVQQPRRRPEALIQNPTRNPSDPRALMPIFPVRRPETRFPAFGGCSPMVFVGSGLPATRTTHGRATVTQ
jgi:hypothetical protein